jgi:predicted RNA-binding protein Jag
MEEKKRPKRYRRDKIDDILIDLQRKLRDSHEPISLQDLNAFERKRIHRFFDNKDDYATKTYRSGDEFTLRVYPVGNIKKLAEAKAQEALESGNTVPLPPMGNYERYIVHDCLKDIDGIETASFGEGTERRVEIRPVKFGRGLKKIMKKIKLFR